MSRPFPPDFLWGTATSAYQIEGAVTADGRGESIWDRFAHTPGTTKQGHTGDVACDHYRRYEEDLDLMVDLGYRAYRFSVAWPRIFPGGDGKVNHRGVGFYRRLAEGLLERGVVPMATLYHWDLPQSLQDLGGWAERDTAARFADYAAAVVSELVDVVPLWITQNEPWVSASLGYGSGIHAPGIRDWPIALGAAHHLLLSHGLAVEAIRSLARPETRVGITLDLYPVYPSTEDGPAREAARRLDGFRNRWFLDPLLRGAYPEDVVADAERQWGPLRWERPGDLELISLPTDFLGVNFYSRWIAAPGGPDDPLEARHVAPAGPVTAMGWEVAPDALFDLLVRLRRDYGDVPLYITENGAAYEDVIGPDGTVRDSERIEYLQSHVAALAEAVRAGVDVRGYFVWSLLDNFEWSQGYTKRFGLVHVDFASQRRTPKASALWYRELIAGDGET